MGYSWYDYSSCKADQRPIPLYFPSRIAAETGEQEEEWRELPRGYTFQERMKAK